MCRLYYNNIGVYTYRCIYSIQLLYTVHISSDAYNNIIVVINTGF